MVTPVKEWVRILMKTACRIASDNCPNYPNGPNMGTCMQVIIAGPITNYIASTGQYCFSDGDCDSGEVCEKTQADNYPPGGNGAGDACECEGSFTCDQSLGSDDVSLFLLDTGRNTYNRPCTNPDPCNGDFLCDGSVDAYDVTKFLEDTGRNLYNNPCPVCDGSAWCSY